VVDQSVNNKIEEFFNQFKHQVYKKGEILIRADDEPSGIFYLKKGIVKEYAISKKGDELVINLFKPVVFFPMSLAFNNAKNKYFFEAITDLEVWRAPKNEVLTFVKNNPDVLYDLVKRVYKGTDGLLTRMTYLMAGNAYTRLITELIIQAQRFGKTKSGIIELKISEKDLGVQSGMARETISREMKTLKDKGLISLEKSVFKIYNIAKLEEELSLF
jgi:CRP-like cAMP-binding protein